MPQTATEKTNSKCAQHGLLLGWTRTPIFLPLAAPPQTAITMPTTCQGSDWSIFQPCARHYYNLRPVMNRTPKWIIKWHAFPSEAAHHHRNAHTLARTHPSLSLHLSIPSLHEGRGRSLHHHRLTNIDTLCNTCYTATMQHTPKCLARSWENCFESIRCAPRTLFVGKVGLKKRNEVQLNRTTFTQPKKNRKKKQSRGNARWANKARSTPTTQEAQ